MAVQPGSRVLFASTQDVGQGLVVIAALPAALVLVAVVDGSVEGNAVELGLVDEPPVGEPGETAPGEKVVVGVPLAGHLEHLALVWLPLEVLGIVAADGVFQGPFQHHSGGRDDDGVVQGLYVWHQYSQLPAHLTPLPAAADPLF